MKWVKQILDSGQTKKDSSKEKKIERQKGDVGARK